MPRIRVQRKAADAYQHGNLREALVQAGLKLLADGGVHALSLRAAAQLAGVSHAAPYRHFEDKDALVSAIGEQGFRLLSARMREELARCASVHARDRLRALGLGYVAFATAHPAYLRVIFGGVVDKSRESPALHEAGHEAYELLRGEVAAGLARGELRGADADTVALAAWSMVHGLSMLLIEGTLARPGSAAPAPAQIVPALLSLLDEGIGARPPARQR